MDRDLHIVAAAVLCNGKIYQGKRHGQIMHQIWDEAGEGNHPYISQEMQGFVASDGKFYNRYQSGAIAYMAGQTKVRHQELNSEHLW